MFLNLLNYAFFFARIGSKSWLSVRCAVFAVLADPAHSGNMDSQVGLILQNIESRVYQLWRDLKKSEKSDDDMESLLIQVERLTSLSSRLELRFQHLPFAAFTTSLHGLFADISNTSKNKVR